MDGCHEVPQSFDGVEVLIIQDTSTCLAGVRTGKLDWISGIDWRNAENFRKTNPELKEVKALNFYQQMLFMRTDKPELPFYDIRVRRALSMAIDHQAMVEEYYGGNAEILAWPVLPLPEYADTFVPLEELPEPAREVFEYHPEKAKQLLAEAGYPDGFTTEIVCYSGMVDELSVVKAYWADIGVDLKLDIKEYGVWNSIFAKRSHNEMMTRFGGGTTPFKLLSLRPECPQNMSMVNDDRINETYKEMLESFFDEPKRRQLLRDLIPYIYENCWNMTLPAYYSYTMWWPWLQNYHGEFALGYIEHYAFPTYVWLDPELKKSMGY